jgi:hypothetical protein
MVLDVTWDAERGWQGLDQAAGIAAEPPAAKLARDPGPDEAAACSTSAPQPSEASRAAFQALLGGAQAAGPRPQRREPPVCPEARVVKPMRPWQVAPSRRTPWDAVREEEPTPSGRVQVRSGAEVQGLVAEVLREREEAAPARSERVVDLAGWVRRQVQR